MGASRSPQLHVAVKYCVGAAVDGTWAPERCQCWCACRVSGRDDLHNDDPFEVAQQESAFSLVGDSFFWQGTEGTNVSVNGAVWCQTER